MSDLEDISDFEEDTLNDTETIEKEDKDLTIVKTIASKKIEPEFNESEYEALTDDDDDDTVDNDSEIENPDIDDEQVYSPEYNQVDNSDGNTVVVSPINSDIDSDDDTDYLQKFEPDSNSEYIKRVHPECLASNAVEIESLTVITRDKDNRIIDENHLTNPFLSKYERTRILGQRAKQINIGHKSYIKIPPGIIDGYLIAEMELKEKKIPVIVRRPLPGGKSEYWKLQDLEQIY
jgi:DNA-directed RNA polymerase subunit K/omega